MAMRLSGLMSGMDTESIIQQLVEAKRTKVNNAKREQTKLEWKQDIWKDLNKKLKNLQSKYLDNMRFTTAYSKKTTKVSNSNAVSVITGESAVNGVQELEIKQLAKTAYLTSGKVSRRPELGNEKVSALTTMGDLMTFEKDGEGNEIPKSLTLTMGDGSKKEIELTSQTTISDMLTTLKDQGLNANFDANQQRFYISAKESGADGNFSFSGDADVLGALGLAEAPAGTSEEDSMKYATYTKGQDARIMLNGALYESKDNVFEINGLTFTALSETNGEKVTVTTQQDTDGIYDMIKGFLKEYNSIINEMDKLYNAESARGFEPLTDEEKDGDSFAGSYLSIGVCLLIPLLFFRNKKTLYDILSQALVGGFSIAALLGINAGIILPLSYLAFGIMWTVTCFGKIPLTAHYSMNEYNGESALQNPLFLKTNRILTLMWGILYLLTPIWTFFLMGTRIRPYTGAVNSVLPALMGLFTVWFQRWYPAKVARGK